MFTGKVIGSVVATRKDEKLIGVKLLVVQPVDSSYRPVGKPLIAADTVGAGAGEYVFLARSREGSLPLPIQGAPVDAGIIGIIDSVDVPPVTPVGLEAIGLKPGEG